MSLKASVFTDELTNDTLTITPEMGVLGISIYNNSAVNGTVLGSQKLAGVNPSALTIEENKSVTFSSIGNLNAPISGLVITAPSGCTLQIIAQV